MDELVTDLKPPTPTQPAEWEWAGFVEDPGETVKYYLRVVRDLKASTRQAWRNAEYLFRHVRGWKAPGWESIIANPTQALRQAVALYKLNSESLDAFAKLTTMSTEMGKPVALPAIGTERLTLGGPHGLRDRNAHALMMQFTLKVQAATADAAWEILPQPRGGKHDQAGTLQAIAGSLSAGQVNARQAQQWLGKFRRLTGAIPIRQQKDFLEEAVDVRRDFGEQCDAAVERIRPFAMRRQKKLATAKKEGTRQAPPSSRPDETDAIILQACGGASSYKTGKKAAEIIRAAFPGKATSTYRRRMQRLILGSCLCRDGKGSRTRYFLPPKSVRTN